MTWSIVARDPKTGALGIAVASGGASAGNRVPFVKAGVGAVAAQGLVSTPYGSAILSMLEKGASPDEITEALGGQEGAFGQRQFHLINAAGENAAYTGEQCEYFAGHILGRGVSVAGNFLAGPHVLTEALKVYNAGQGDPIPERLLAALMAGQSAGGDIRGVRSAGLTVATDQSSTPIQISADASHDPIGEIKNMYAREQRRQQTARLFAQQIIGPSASMVDGAKPGFTRAMGQFITGRNNGGLY